MCLFDTGKSVSSVCFWNVELPVFPTQISNTPLPNIQSHLSSLDSEFAVIILSFQHACDVVFTSRDINVLLARPEFDIFANMNATLTVFICSQCGINNQTP